MRNAPGKPWQRRIGRAMTIAALLFTGVAAASESAQDYPSRPIHLISGFEPGGATDVVARMVGRQLSRVLGASVVIDNKPGASGNIGAGYVARSDPDGYTLYLANATVAMPSMFRDLRFNIHKDFAPLSLIGYGPSVLIANPKAPVKSVKEFIEYAKQHEGKFDYGSGGVGNITHMAMELFISMTGIKLIHIPYKGGAPATTAVMTGEVPIAFSAISDVIGHVKDGTVVPLAISSRDRSPALPNVPTVAEAGVPGYEATSWYGIVAPAATPKAIQDKLTQALITCLQDKGMQKDLINLGIEPADTGGSQEFKSYIDSEINKWAKVIAQGHIAAR